MLLMPQPQPILEEVADSAVAPAAAGLPIDEGLGLLGRAGRVPCEMSLEGVLVLDQGAPWLMPGAEAQAIQATLTVLVEVALDGATGDIVECGDVVVPKAVALEPGDIHLTLD